MPIALLNGGHQSFKLVSRYFKFLQIYSRCSQCGWKSSRCTMRPCLSRCTTDVVVLKRCHTPGLKYKYKSSTSGSDSSTCFQALHFSRNSKRHDTSYELTSVIRRLQGRGRGGSRRQSSPESLFYLAPLALNDLTRIASIHAITKHTNCKHVSPSRCAAQSACMQEVSCTRGMHDVAGQMWCAGTPTPPANTTCIEHRFSTHHAMKPC